MSNVSSLVFTQSHVLLICPHAAPPPHIFNYPFLHIYLLSPLYSPNSNDPFNEIPMCGFLSVRYYQPYFDVDTDDVIARMKNSLLFLKQTDNFFSIVGEKPDLYGPFWVATTLVFIVAFTSHVNSFLTSWMDGRAWNYNFQTVLTTASLIYAGGVDYI